MRGPDCSSKEAGDLLRGQASAAGAGGEDAFRRLFRFYRQRDASDLRGVVDFSAPGVQNFLELLCM
uniref:Uncharacterized protein n=1 Tax=Junco hyemalis TaxID=40217 RepID=A0A8C5J8R9_JUNHY